LGGCEASRERKAESGVEVGEGGGETEGKVVITKERKIIRVLVRRQALFSCQYSFALCGGWKGAPLSCGSH